MSKLLRQKLQHNSRVQKQKPLRGQDLVCPKCGHQPLLVQLKKTEKVETVDFRCSKCKLSDSIIKKGAVFEVIDYYNMLVDRFNAALNVY